MSSISICGIKILRYSPDLSPTRYLFLTKLRCLQVQLVPQTPQAGKDLNIPLSLVLSCRSCISEWCHHPWNHSKAFPLLYPWISTLNQYDDRKDKLISELRKGSIPEEETSTLSLVEYSPR